MSGEEQQQEVFTRWFNVDKPWHVSSHPDFGNGDYETVDNIKLHFDTICEDMYHIVKAECRLKGREQEIFSENHPIDTGDILSTFCTRDGLVCRAEDQPQGHMCGDYSVRFLCKYVGRKNGEPDENLFPEFDARIYLVLAVVPVLIFLIRLAWAYIFRRRRRQRRRQRREQRRRRGEASDGDEDDDDDDDEDGRSINSDLARPPPSYQELFSGGSPSVFTISGNSLTACAKCKDAQCSVVKARGGGSQVGQTSTGPSNSPPSSPTTSSSISSGDTPASDTSSSSQEQQAGDVPLQSLTPSESSSLAVLVVNETTEAGSTNEQRQSDQTAESNDSTIVRRDTTTVNLTMPTDTGIPADVPSPCACACHQTSPFIGQGVAGYVNPGFTSDSSVASPSNGTGQYRGRHVPAIPRPVSSISIVSQITLSELPSYEDALKLEKKFAAGVVNT
ncbi:cartilage intermediate layer protein 1-like [Plakobranchus ocellatus]|uniref:Cartilage intermediate layer protein 1-like n=1 Tax=Plakobranchus ocellatus TaxID=259542 RepID=A0AAV3Y0I6_9GAST|nr:cartilage intermediate layer protein 1-like [Plakobranchus ocellatus]